MADIKQASFMFLIILVSISAVYEWAASEPVLRDQLGISEIEGFESASLLSDLDTFQISTDNLITTVEQTDILGLLPAMTSFFSSIINIFMRLAFGWSQLVTAIFDSIGVPGISIIFIGPIAVFQMLGAFYLLRDLVNTVRGVR